MARLDIPSSVDLGSPTPSFVAFKMVIASQWSKHESVTYLWELLDAKKTYVRYIRCVLAPPG